MKPGAFHAACLFVHWVNAVMVFFIAKKLLGRLLPHLEPPKIIIYAFFISLIFSIHPLQVESVAWISASKIILYGFFTLVALYTYIVYIQTSNWIWLIITAIAYLLGFASKEQAIILPLNFLLLDFVFGRFADQNNKRLFLSKVILEKIPFFIIALSLWYFSFINNFGTVKPDGYPIYQRIMFGLYSISEYIFRFLAPVKMYFFHSFPISPDDSLPLYYYGYILLIGIIIYFIWNCYRRGSKIVLIGFLFFIINLLLVLHIIPFPRPVITADRYMYLSILGLALIITGLVDQWTSFQKRLIVICACVIWILFLAVHSFLRTSDWKNSETIKTNVYEILEREQNLQEQTPFNIIENE
ncbi:hypothetical protein [Algoriphagus persicinus]|uniref:hypothetical protein n=1 Tax=Algoriphagus persicinus TaxID=3108754 RepID=UPI002B3F48F6|nr:hypothetical protein [Algoriphagus sp. E1-3-M2]MEB2786956.1 hypothetical protein [Algoriphagus sp. E1-3-M2]